MTTPTSVTFTFTPTFNGFSAPTITKTISSVQVTSATGFTSIIQVINSTTTTIKNQLFILINFNFKSGTNVSFSSTIPNVAIRQSVTYNATIRVPPFSNIRSVLYFSCIDVVTGRAFCNINSVSVTSAGCNVDGFWQEYSYGLIPVIFSRTTTTDNFYNDTATLDLGFLTNTGISSFF